MYRPERECKEFARLHKHGQIPIREIHCQVTDERCYPKVANHLSQLNSVKRAGIGVNSVPDKVLYNEVHRTDEYRHH
jgi:hypothetical protein